MSETPEMGIYKIAKKEVTEKFSDAIERKGHLPSFEPHSLQGRLPSVIFPPLHGYDSKIKYNPSVPEESNGTSLGCYPVLRELFNGQLEKLWPVANRNGWDEKKIRT